MPNLNITNIPAPRVPFIDERTGLMAREWYRFFLNLFVLTGSGNNPVTLEELQLAPQYEDQSGNFLATLDTAQLMSMMSRFENAEAAIQGAYLQPVVQTGTIANYNLDGSPTAGGVAYGTGPALAVSAAGTSSQVLTSGGAGTPTWATAQIITPGTLYVDSVNNFVGINAPTPTTPLDVTANALYSGGFMTNVYNTVTGILSEAKLFINDSTIYQSYTYDTLGTPVALTFTVEPVVTTITSSNEIQFSAPTVNIPTLTASTFTLNGQDFTVSGSNLTSSTNINCTNTLAGGAKVTISTAGTGALSDAALVFNNSTATAVNFAVGIDGNDNRAFKISRSTTLGGGGNDAVVIRSDNQRVGIGATYATITAPLTVGGVAAFAAGTAPLPAIARSTDLDTGIYFPAANTVGITTGGAERGNFSSTGLAVTGGFSATTGINSTTIGATTAATVQATTIAGTDTTDASSTTAAALKTAGGLAVAKKIYVGDNIVPTAAKGVNFSGNTPAAGMTSQLLNWYEQGTFTPTLTTWTVIGAESHTGLYTRIGRQVTVVIELSAATSLASTGASTITGLPFSASGTAIAQAATMTDTGGTGSSSNGYIFGATIYPGTSAATSYKFLTVIYFTS